MSNLFSITILQEYFNWKGGKNIQVLPNTPTQQIMDRYGLFLTNNDTSYLFSSNKPKNQLTNQLAYIAAVVEPTALEFNIVPLDPSFYTYTHVSFNFNGKYIFQPTSSQKGGNQHEFDQLNKVEGDYSEFATLQIGFDQLQKTIEHSASTPDFQLKLAATKTRWEYYIINTSNVSINALTIKGKNNVQFAQQEKTTLENGQQAIPFIMEGEKLPLTQESLYQFNLLNQKNGLSHLSSQGKKEKIIYKNLPQPKPSNIKIQNGGEGISISSPIYVYI